MVKLDGKRGTFGLWTEQLKSLGGWNSIFMQSCELLCKKTSLLLLCFGKTTHIIFNKHYIMFHNFGRSVHIMYLKFDLGFFILPFTI